MIEFGIIIWLRTHDIIDIIIWLYDKILLNILCYHLAIMIIFVVITWMDDNIDDINGVMITLHMLTFGVIWLDDDI